MNELKSLQYENVEPEKEAPKKRNKPDIEEGHMTANELADLKKGKVTIQSLANKRLELKKVAENKLNRIFQQTQEVSPSTKHLRTKFQNELEDTKSPEKTEQIIERIEKLEEEEAAKNKELTFDSPEIREYWDKIKDLLNSKETEKYIGSKQTGPFLSWCKDEITKKPTIKTAEEILHRLHHDQNGLKPRKAFYLHHLAPKLKKYGVNLEEAKFFKEEGLTERQDALRQIEGIEKTIDGMKNTGLYSLKAKKKIMQELFKCRDSHGMNDIEDKLKKVTRNESEQFTKRFETSIFTQTTVTVHGETIQAMSHKSAELYLADYKDYDIDLREKSVLNWEKVAKNEGELIKKLGEIYEDDPDSFFEALEGFKLLSYQEKEKSLKNHKSLVENNEKETRSESLKIQQRGLQAIEKNRSDLTLSTSTANEFKRWVLNTKLYSDSDGKIDLEKQSKMIDEMTSKTPVFEKENRNIEAYRFGKAKFEKTIEKFEKENPEIGKEEIFRIKEEYYEGGYSERRETYQKLKERMFELAKEKELNNIKEKELGINEEKKAEAQTNNPKRQALIDQLKYIKNKEKTPEKIQEGLMVIYLYLAFSGTKITDDQELMDIRSEFEELQKTIGTVKAANDDDEETEMEKTAEHILQEDSEMAKRMEEEQIIAINIKGAKMSEQRHGNQKNAQKRAEKESLTKKEKGSVEHDLTKDAYKQMGEGFIVNEQDTGEETSKLEIDDIQMSTEEQQEYKQETRKQQKRIYSKEGIIVSLVDKSGKKISGEEAESKEEVEAKDMDKDLAAKMQENRARDEKLQGKGSDAPYDINQRITAERIARDLRHKKTSENLKAA